MEHFSSYGGELRVELADEAAREAGEAAGGGAGRGWGVAGPLWLACIARRYVVSHAEFLFMLERRTGRYKNLFKRC